MHLDSPLALLFLVFVLPAALWILHKGFERSGITATLFKVTLPNRRRYVAKRAFLIIFLVSLVMVGAKPYMQPRVSGDYIILSDVSRSMMARNYCSEPTFFERSREVMHKIITDIPEARFGIVAFDRFVFPVSQMTYEHSYLHKVIDFGIDVGMIFEATATDIGAALSVVASKKESLRSVYGNVEYIILVSDGFISGDWHNDLKEPIQELKRTGIKVITVGIGNPGETPIPRTYGEGCIDEYLVYDGQTLRIPLQDDLLKYISSETEGEYFDESTVDNLIDFIRHETLSPIQAQDNFNKEQQQDISSFFLISATISFLLFLLL